MLFEEKCLFSRSIMFNDMETFMGMLDIIDDECRIRSTIAAASHDRCEMLEILLMDGIVPKESRQSFLLLTYAMGNDSLTTFEWLLKNGYKFQKGICPVDYVGGTNREVVKLLILYKAIDVQPTRYSIKDIINGCHDDQCLVYFHDNTRNLPNMEGIWDCDSGKECYLCSISNVRKAELLEDYWTLECEMYDSFIQWLPREMLDDTVSIL